MAGTMLLYTLSIVTLLHTCFAVPVDLFNLSDELLDDEKTDSGYRLPKDFMPERYLIRLSNINFEQGTFTGDTEVTFTSKVNKNVLKIHADSLDGTLDKTKVKIVIPNEPGKQVRVTDITSNTTYGMLTITVNSEDEFKEGRKYRLEFKGYTGYLTHGVTGFYRSKYPENGAVEWMGSTYMHPGHARQVFPCFDEPYFKAKFILSIERPDGFKASFANMQGIERRDQETNAWWDYFEETPVMSTYLVAFIVSKYDAINGTTVNGNTFRILSRSSAAGQGSYAFEIGQQLEKKMSAYMRLDYYTMGIKKMDQATIPDFLSGAMENWGLIMYREAFLLSKEDTTSVRDRQFISAILAHEISHMWFGNYITCHWWSDTWLNEGFGRFFQYRLPDMTSTDSKMNIQFPLDVVQGAMIADTSVNSAPLSNPNVNSPQEVSGHFSTISYHKGASIIRMMEQWIGEQQFQDALNIYLREHKYGTVTPEHLYAALQQRASQSQNVAVVMSTWVKQSGYPLITVDVNYNAKTMTLSQARFKKARESKRDTIYQVPITYAAKSKRDFENTATDYLLTAAGPESVQIDINGEEWIVLNKQQIGYYRVNYDAKTWNILNSALLGSERTNIHQINRAQIVDDVFNLAREEVISYNRTFDILEFLRDETEYAPWTSAFAGFAFIRRQFSVKPSLSKKLHDHIIVLINKLVKERGFTDEGDLLTQLFRLNTMNFACSVGHKDCVDYAKNTFNEYLERGVSVPPNHREFVYCTGLREGNAASYDKLWTEYRRENYVAGERVVILGALGCTKDETKIIELLDEISKENSEIRDQDVNTPINSILNGNLENTEYVLKYLENDFMKLRNRLGSYSSLFTNLGSRLTGNQIGRFNDLIVQNYQILTRNELLSGKAANNNLLDQGSYLDEAGREIEIWLNERYKDAGVLATSSFMLLCVVLLAHLFNVQL